MPVRALATVNLSAIERNVERLRRELAAGTALCAVVKADGYGHGAAQAAAAALAGGASSLAVATAGEADSLSRTPLRAPVLVLGAVSDEELPLALGAGAELVAWDERFVDRLLHSAGETPIRVHVKLDSGMGRLGTRDPAQALRVARAVLQAAPRLELAGAMTHFATADADPEFVEQQLRAFAPYVEELRKLAPGVAVHAANSAATLGNKSSHFDLVRCGVAIYGLDPMQGDPMAAGLEPALELRSYVAAVKLARPGESAGYGRMFVADRETLLATLPIGYADGFPRSLSNNCDVLIGGRRHPLVGAVSMDNITVDLGAPGSSESVEVGTDATLIGDSGGQRQTAEELAQRAGTINYEIVCRISGRVTRRYHRDGADLDAAQAA
jgi:alanine racemase